MNEDPDGLDCPICFSPIIGPHSINCGHTICYDCFNRLRDTKCPVCRYEFKSKDKAGVNILLDKLLLERIDNYQTRFTSI